MSLRVAIVGCGKIADAHAEQIRHTPGCRLVAVCDREPLMARQLAERFGVDHTFTEIEQVLADMRPDVVHITTPPQSHHAIARRCLEAGSHVYVEKPFTVDAREAEDLIALADTSALRLTVGHDAQFSHAARRMRELVHAGAIGDAVVHMEGHYGYDLGDPAYARAFLGQSDHWVRRLPGGLLQNVISHGIARIAEFLHGKSWRVTAQAFTSPSLTDIECENVLDELRVMIVDEAKTTASFTFSSRMRPPLHQFRLFGSRHALVLDEHQQTVVKLRGTPLKSYAERFLGPLILANQYARNVGGNVGRFLRNDFHMESGKRDLIRAFYRSITDGTPVPIPYSEILTTARLMDAIFEQISVSPSKSSAKGVGQC
jgi:predicted dehydrogenase